MLGGVSKGAGMSGLEGCGFLMLYPHYIQVDAHKCTKKNWQENLAGCIKPWPYLKPPTSQGTNEGDKG